jgi:arsenite methyltransferase
MQDYLDSTISLDSRDTVTAYDELSLWSAMFGLLLLKHVELKQNIRVLDVGCGTGFPLLELAQRLGRTSTVCGIDTWDLALERARLKARIWQVPNVTIRKADAAALPFAAEEFDLVVSNLGINNFADPEKVLKECARVTKAGGKVALTTNLQGHMGEFYDVFEKTLRDVGDDRSLQNLGNHIEKRATITGLKKLFETAGFDLSRIHEDLAVMRFADGSALLRHYFMRLGFIDGWKNIVSSKDDVAETFLSLEKNLNNLAEANGALELTIPMAYVEAVRIQD